MGVSIINTVETMTTSLFYLHLFIQLSVIFHVSCITIPVFTLCPSTPPAACTEQCRGQPCQSAQCSVGDCEFSCNRPETNAVCLPAGCTRQDGSHCARWCFGGDDTSPLTIQACFATCTQIQLNTLRPDNSNTANAGVG